MRSNSGIFAEIQLLNTNSEFHSYICTANWPTTDAVLFVRLRNPFSGFHVKNCVFLSLLDHAIYYNFSSVSVDFCVKKYYNYQIY